MRAFYDVDGRTLAQYRTHLILADLACLSLKPFEWFMRWLLGLLIPQLEAYTSQVYGSEPGRTERSGLTYPKFN
jgi:hypothetical protein